MWMKMMSDNDAGPVNTPPKRGGSFEYNSTLFTWREHYNGEILFRKKGSKNKEMGINDLVVTLAGKESDMKQRELATVNIVNKVLPAWRLMARPDNNKYYAAAAAIDTGGRMYAAFNHENINNNPFEGRGCAETAMLDKYKRRMGNDTPKFSSIYLMSGKVRNDSYKKDGTLEEATPGAVSCLCGECRRNLRPYLAEATFFMLPTNDGKAELTINDSAASSSEVMQEPHQAWKLSYKQMYPQPVELECDSTKNAKVLDGYRALNSAKKMPPLKTGFDGILNGGRLKISRAFIAGVSQFIDAFRFPSMAIVGLNANPAPENINRSLLHLVKEVYDAHKEDVPFGQNLKITAVIIKSTENPAKFYPATLVDGDGWLTNKPQIFATALSNMGNRKGIADVYVMNFDLHKLEDLRRNNGMAGSNNAPYTEAVPDPAMIGRLLKNMRPQDNPHIHIIPVNDGKMKPSELENFQLKPINVREAFGPGFDNPKKEVAAHR